MDSRSILTGDYTETVTVTRPIDPRLADLIRFARYVEETRRRVGGRLLSDAEMVDEANAFWDQQHGED